MTSLAKHLAGLALAAAFASSAAAQGVVTQKNISLPMAQAMANAAIEKCHSMGYKTSVSVIDRGGLTLATLRDENAGLHTAESSVRRVELARQGRRLRRPASTRWPITQVSAA